MPSNDESIRQLQKDVRTLNEAMVEHRVRLENGTRVFSQQREEIARVDGRVDRIDEQLRPRAPSIVKIVAVSFGIFATLSGALWFLSEKLADRPTTTQLKAVVETHEKSGHPKTIEQIGKIREDLGEQRGLINDVRNDQSDVKEKLDDLLTRVPKRRRSQ